MQIRYLGRRSGLPRMVRARTVKVGDDFIVRVSSPEKRQWWRNFWTPWPVVLVEHDHMVVGTGRAVDGASTEGAVCAASYFREFPIKPGYRRLADPNSLLFVRVFPSDARRQAARQEKADSGKVKKTIAAMA